MKKRAGYFLFHLTLLVVFSLFAFGHNPGRLFIGNDGPMVLALAKHQLDFFGISFNLHTNFQQGIGNLSFPLNLSIMPGFWLPFMDSAGNFTPAAIYTWFAALMFVTVLLVGWNYRFARGITYAAAWLLTILMFPYFEKYFAIYAVTASSPLFIWYMFATAIADIGVQRMGKNWRYAAFLFAGIFLMVAASPAAVMLIAPFLAASFIVSFLRSNREQRTRQSLAAAGVVALCAALGWVEYSAGLLLYSSSGFFLKDLMNSYAPAREFSSILFQGHQPDRAFGPILFCLATCGAGWTLYKKETNLRNAALVTLAGQVLHAGIAAQLLVMSGGWSGPPAIYTEMTFFALYSLFALHFLATLSERYWQPVRHLLPLVFVGLMSLVLLARPAMVERDMLQGFAMPPASSPVTDLLEKEIPALPSTPFGGRVATVLAANSSGQLLYSYRYNIALKNDHLSDGLWLHNIPTLTEYNQLITPAFYRIVRTFLTVPNDKQNRSWASFSYLDTRILRMLGVRFFFTTSAVVEGAQLQQTLEVPHARPLHLFELQDANIAGKSADKIIRAASVQEAENIMASKDFDLNSAVVFSAVPEQTTPVSQSSIALENGSYHIRASSKGKSMLIVPVEYSRCMDVTAINGAMPQAIRVNIALTGLVFEREMDILLSTNIGPFHHPRCRLKDYQDFKAIWKE